ncbi:polysaccharide pyruvyl transferase family protein [Promicromonospora sp. MEB111]|uniref:polysaccharide pyruvyl transferase family protein n=1 Tax=unclassified Promicromonospora TaxID=2647929 RepID=UPI00254F1469|nr:polysaccharide pyruvyl transferase family protein [Promicromonospora sp. MEB111]
MTSEPPHIFAWLTGQEDNVGDSALRRPYLHALADAGDVTVWCGDPGSGYSRGLALPLDVRVATSYLRWWAAFVSSAVRRPTVLAFNAGEFDVTKAYLVGVVALLPWLPLIRSRGGGIVWVGAGIRRRRTGLMWPFRALARLADLLTWRDRGSAELLAPAPIVPDWAFGLPRGGLLEENPPQPARDCVVVSLRSDRPMPTRDWIRAVSGFARRVDASVVVVAQVQRDDDRARHVAGLLGATCVGWCSDDHGEQELQLRQVYRRAHAVVSDRLHVLILAATEGAVPLGWCEQATAKIDRHFDVVGAEWVGAGRRDPTTELDALDRAELADLTRRTASVVRAAAARVHEVAHRISSVVTSRAARRRYTTPSRRT